MSKVKLMLGDNIASLKKLPDNSIDSIVSDPPYGLSFMNKKWDYDVPSVEFWKEVYRVLKPGGHILSFGGTRTYHRMVVNIEDAGFEIRDQIMWLYGSGFPKSHNIGKAVDKLEGNEREVVRERTGAMNNSETSEAASFVKDGVGFKTQGFGTALKPANEPICLARKPLSEKSIAENVLKWNTGAINIDGCRIGTETITTTINKGPGDNGIYGKYKGMDTPNYNEGRFPANILLDEEAAELLDEQSGISSSKKRKNPSTRRDTSVLFGGIGITNTGEGEYDDKGGASRFFYVAKVSKAERNAGLDNFEDKKRPGQNDTGLYSSSPYCIDCGKTVNGTNDHSNCKEGLEYRPSTTTTKNNHPTVKPINLMTYLCRLITPPGGIVLDPFMGSGSTGIAARLEGFKFCGMEMDKDYFDIASARIENYEEYRKFIKK